MRAHEAERLIDTIKSLVDGERAPANGEQRPGKSPLKGKPLDDDGAIAFEPTSCAALTGQSPEQLERTYQLFKARMIDDLRIDPILLQLIASRPEIEVLVEPQIIQLEGSSLKGRVARLIAADYFVESRATSAVRWELARTGSDPGGGGNLSKNLSELKRDGFLVNDGDRWVRAPGVKVTEKVIQR